jgi:hypothetical protein
MKWYWWFLTALFAVLGILTLVPSIASKPNLIGYYSHCTFTPISTIICWVIAALCYWFGRKEPKNIGSKTPHFSNH